MVSRRNPMRPLDPIGRSPLHRINTQPVRDQRRPLLHHPARHGLHAASQRQTHAPHDPSRVASQRSHINSAFVRLGQTIRSPTRASNMRRQLGPQVSNLRHSRRLLSAPHCHDHHLHKHIPRGQQNQKKRNGNGGTAPVQHTARHLHQLGLYPSDGAFTQRAQHEIEQKSGRGRDAEEQRVRERVHRVQALPFVRFKPRNSQ